ncbi:MAG: sigma 54-interacting transcriptional regulator, partial [Burkholderiales bacterium]|nr:sigma 54-interacting transcriptional regulator [Burkholderiales bacterium]
GALAESLLEAELFGYEDGAFTGSRRGGHAGLFEAAHNGTLFLDEIGEMPLLLQTRLLRVLEERVVVRVGGTKPIPVQIRIICATHCDLLARVQAGQFRADLYYRLAVLRVTIPPLRARQEDVLELAAWCLKNAIAALGARATPNLHAELQTCSALLTLYSWPGNVRQLRNVMERLALFLAEQPLQALTPNFLLSVAPELADGATPTSVEIARLAPPSSTTDAPAPLAEPAEDIHAVLARFGGKRDAAAQYLGISRTTLWRKLQASNKSTS